MDCGGVSGGALNSTYAPQWIKLVVIVNYGRPVAATLWYSKIR